MQNIYTIKDFLSLDELSTINSKLTHDLFVDGRDSASGMAKNVKKNLQIDPNRVPEIFELLLEKFKKK